MLAYHIIRAQAEYRSRDLPVPRRALYHWALSHDLHEFEVYLRAMGTRKIIYYLLFDLDRFISVSGGLL